MLHRRRIVLAPGYVKRSWRADRETLWVVAKVDRRARSLPDARNIIDDLTLREVKLSIGGSVHDPADPIGRLLFNVLAMVALAGTVSSAIFAPLFTFFFRRLQAPAEDLRLGSPAVPIG